VLRRVALCCAVLRRVALCRAVLRRVALCCAVLRYAVLCCAVLRCAALCCALRCAVLRCAALCCALRCAVLRCAALCCAVLCVTHKKTAHDSAARIGNKKAALGGLIGFYRVKCNVTSIASPASFIMRSIVSASISSPIKNQGKRHRRWSRLGYQVKRRKLWQMPKARCHPRSCHVRLSNRRAMICACNYRGAYR